MNKRNHQIRQILLLFWAFFLGSLLLIWNARAYAPINHAETTLAQLRFLKTKLETGTAEQMQQIFPEGFFFSWVLYGLGNAQLAAQLEANDAEKNWLLENAVTALTQLESDAGKNIFPKELKPPYGAFYNAWLLYLQAQTIKAMGKQTNAKLLEKFAIGCAAFAAALEQSQTPFLQSYTYQSWAVDTSIGIGALGIHDQILEPKFKAVIANWINKAKQRLEPNLGTLVHLSDYQTGKPLDGTRGSSLAMMILAIANADPDFAVQQYTALRQHFFATPLGIPAILEYPHGSSGKGDVDSGPIVMGFSGPSIIVGMGAAIAMNDLSTARALNGFVETGGLAVQIFGKRAYLLGALPIGDAFLVWIRTLTPQTKLEWQPILPTFWAWGLHLLTMLLLLRIALAVRARAKGKPVMLKP